MRKIMLAVVLVASNVTLFPADPFAGTWRFNLAKSKGAALPKEATRTIREHGENVQVTITGIRSDGAPILLKYIISQQGGTGKVTEGPYDHVSVTHLDDHTREVKYTRNGKTISVDREFLTEDANAIRIIRKGTEAQGQSFATLEIFERQ